MCTYFPWVDWISDTRSQGYTDLQSLVKCLDHRDALVLNYLPDPDHPPAGMLPPGTRICLEPAYEAFTSCQACAVTKLSFARGQDA